ncbi:MAG: asparagine synthase (glutamine-hydrolyzing) [Fibrobacterota bacterium]|nr:asparagine synthase (glutamine-hydrolyzing) [Fibrobacterota bacterium]QQS07061.1 MAG: asparagine synthase (glutamine-hydrolyzing) [Fibrobacterota bacterium]
MCGIIGIVSRRPEIGSFSFEAVKPTFVHRGPNDYGEHHAPHVHFGHARLSIQDLSPAGHQPMASLDARFVLVFNGEIYNFPELRETLRARGRSFVSTGDTEVLLAAFQEWGEDCVNRLHGMFAFAIWDSLTRKLTLARDRFGEKPLYVRFSDERLYFASELKSMVAMLPEEPSLDPVAFDLYLHYQYVPEPRTPFMEIAKCPRAHLAVLDVDSWQLEYRRYWSVKDIPALDGDPVQLVREGFEKSVVSMLRADVDVGLALSGGIDSGAIAALAARHSTKETHSFGIGYPGSPPYDERAKAKALADTLGLRFHDRELVTSELVDFFPGLVRAIDEPIADIAAFGHYSVARSAADAGLKVLLTGIGGDEIFWGYGWFRQAAEHNSRVLATDPRAPAIFNDLVGDFQRMRAWRPSILSPRFLEQVPSDNAPALFQHAVDPSDVGNSVCELGFDTWLVGNCLSLGDKVSMACSIETRLPFLDVPLVETLIGLRKTREDFRLGHKSWLIESLRGILPDEVLSRPKSGFEPPVVEWIQSLCQANLQLLTDGICQSSLGLLPDFHRHADPILLYKVLFFNAWHQWAVRDVRSVHGAPLRKQLSASVQAIRIEEASQARTEPPDFATVLFLYNRPDHAQQVIAALKRDHVQRLIVHCDAPAKPEHEEGVRKTRELLRSIDWTTPEIILREQNAGLARSVVETLNHAFESNERVVVLEDDCVPTADFIAYMTDCFRLYRDDPQIYGISGYTIPIPDDLLASHPYDAYKFPRMSTWGWGTWRDRWMRDNRNLQELLQKCAHTGIDLAQGGMDVVDFLGEYLEGRLKDVWSLPWLVNVYLRNGLYIYPTRSLIHNIGLDGSGAHQESGDRKNGKLAPSRITRLPPAHVPAGREERIDRHFREFCRSQTKWTPDKIYAKIRGMNSTPGTVRQDPPPRRGPPAASEGFHRHPSSKTNPGAVQWQPGCSVTVGEKCDVQAMTVCFDKPGAHVKIGDRTFIGRSMLVAADGIEVGSDVLVAWGCTFADHDSHSLDFEERKSDVENWLVGKKDWTHVRHAPVHIGDKAWIGFNSVILKGVTIGEGAVVAAGSVVTKDVEPWTLVAGNPARFVKKAPDRSGRPATSIEPPLPTTPDKYDQAYLWGWNEGNLRELIGLCYKTPDLPDNARRYAASAEFGAALQELAEAGKPPSASTRVLDLGCGNGAACWALARAGYAVTGIDSSHGQLTGIGAARKLDGLDGIRFKTIHTTAESLPFGPDSFDVVWMREVLHHIRDIPGFFASIAQLLRSGGVLIAMRDHVVWNDRQKRAFFEDHPFHRFTGDENCHFLDEYLDAAAGSGLEFAKVIDPLASPINTYPQVFVPGAEFDPEAASRRDRGNDLFSFVLVKK